MAVKVVSKFRATFPIMEDVCLFPVTFSYKASNALFCYSVFVLFVIYIFRIQFYMQITGFALLINVFQKLWTRCKKSSAVYMREKFLLYTYRLCTKCFATVHMDVTLKMKESALQGIFKICTLTNYAFEVYRYLQWLLLSTTLEVFPSHVMLHIRMVHVSCFFMIYFALMENKSENSESRVLFLFFKGKKKIRDKGFIKYFRTEIGVEKVNYLVRQGTKKRSTRTPTPSTLPNPFLPP